MVAGFNRFVLIRAHRSGPLHAALSSDGETIIILFDVLVNRLGEDPFFTFA